MRYFGWFGGYTTQLEMQSICICFFPHICNLNLAIVWLPLFCYSFLSQGQVEGEKEKDHSLPDSGLAQEELKVGTNWIITGVRAAKLNFGLQCFAD